MFLDLPFLSDYPYRPLSFTSGPKCWYYLDLPLIHCPSAVSHTDVSVAGDHLYNLAQAFSWALAWTSCFLAHLNFPMSLFLDEVVISITSIPSLLLFLFLFPWCSWEQNSLIIDSFCILLPISFFAFSHSAPSLPSWFLCQQPSYVSSLNHKQNL